MIDLYIWNNHSTETMGQDDRTAVADALIQLLKYFHSHLSLSILEF